MPNHTVKLTVTTDDKALADRAAQTVIDIIPDVGGPGTAVTFDYLTTTPPTEEWNAHLRAKAPPRPGVPTIDLLEPRRYPKWRCLVLGHRDDNPDTVGCARCGL